MTPMRANIIGPPSVATRIKASIADCHSVVMCSAFGSLVICVPASCSVTSWRPRRDQLRELLHQRYPRAGLARHARPGFREIAGLRRCGDDNGAGRPMRKSTDQMLRQLYHSPRNPEIDEVKLVSPRSMIL
jgi:hypothetical protein